MDAAEDVMPEATRSRGGRHACQGEDRAPPAGGGDARGARAPTKRPEPATAHAVMSRHSPLGAARRQRNAGANVKGEKKQNPARQSELVEEHTPDFGRRPAAPAGLLPRPTRAPGVLSPLGAAEAPF